MNDANLEIARQLLEALANEPCDPVGSGVKDRDKMAVKRIIEAARANYVLPSYCAEMNSVAAKCIECIVDHNPPAICRDRVFEQEGEESGVEWDED